MAYRLLNLKKCAKIKKNDIFKNWKNWPQSHTWRPSKQILNIKKKKLTSKLRLDVLFKKIKLHNTLIMLRRV
jgi:hypothetical protein